MLLVLTILPDQTLRFDHEGVTYAPLANDPALGALLFALGVHDADVDLSTARVAERPELQLVLATARQFAHLLARHAARANRTEPLLPTVVSEDTARTWLVNAAAAVPAAEQERFCWRVARRLGAAPWSDGRAAIELHNQQFGLFEASFEDAAAAEGAQDAQDGQDAKGSGLQT
jgi:hypothetical protein